MDEKQSLPVDKCPHRHIQHCPLYIASHDDQIGGLGCVDDITEGCLVQRGKWQYAHAVAGLTAVSPRLVATALWHEENRNASEQRTRNMKLMGIH